MRKVYAYIAIILVTAVSQMKDSLRSREVTYNVEVIMCPKRYDIETSFL